MSCENRIQKRDFDQKYRKLERIGRGNFGVVYEIKKISTNQKFVLKVIKCSSTAKYEEALAEIRIQSSLTHPLILKVLLPSTQIFEYYVATFTSKSDPDAKEYEVGFIMERGYCSLENVIGNPTYRYELEDVRRFLAKFIALGVYLQRQRVVHRDIKPANVIIFGQHLEFKLADFGLACESSKRPRGFAGTLAYCSPWLRIYHQRGDNHANHMSEPFKDEVYSIAKTVEEALFRIEPASFNRQGSDYRQLRDVLDWMMCESEPKRPNFLDLQQVYLVSSYLEEKSVSQAAHDACCQGVSVVRDSESRTVKKVEERSEEEDCKNTGRQTDKATEFSLGKFSLRAMQRINHRLILCGSEDGQLLMFDKALQQKLYLDLVHNPFVVRIVADEEGNIWSIGGDGTIYRFLLDQLIRATDSCNRLPTFQKKFILGREQREEKVYFKVGDNVYRIMQANEKKKEAVSYLEAVDDNTFAVGYADGTVHGRYKGKPFNFDSCSDLITCLKFKGDLLYASGYNGMVKMYNLKERCLVNRFFRFQAPIIDFQVRRQNYHVAAVTAPGHLLIKHETGEEEYSFQEELEARNIIASCFRSERDHILYLTEQGELYDGIHPILSCKVRHGWNCLHFTGRELLMGSYSGHIAILTISE